MIALRLIIRGDVQGVGYRHAMVMAAKAVRVAGWVRNRRDGTVEALAQGESDAVEQLLTWCRSGPPAARVTAVATVAADVDPALGPFEPRPTA